MKRPIVSLPSKRVALAEVMDMRALRAGMIMLIGEVDLRLDVTLDLEADPEGRLRLSMLILWLLWKILMRNICYRIVLLFILNSGRAKGRVRSCSPEFRLESCI